jgi:transposase-like protein
MSVSKKNYSSNEKFRIAMEVLQNSEPISAVCQKYGVSKTALQNWVNILKNNGNLLYEKDNSNSNEVNKLQENLEQTRARLGELLVENDFLKKASTLISKKRIK